MSEYKDLMHRVQEIAGKHHALVESGDPSLNQDFVREEGFTPQEFISLYHVATSGTSSVDAASGARELLGKVIGANDRLKGAQARNHEGALTVYETGNDETAWNTKVVARDGFYRVDVFDADGDIRFSKGGGYVQLLEAIGHADFAVLPWQERELYSAAERFPPWSHEDAASAAKEDWRIDVLPGVNSSSTWQVVGTNGLSDEGAWARMLVGAEPHHAAARAFMEANNPGLMQEHRQSKGVRTYYAVAHESESSGAVNWYYRRDIAEGRVAELQQESYTTPGDQINVFEFSVSPGLSRDEVTEIASSMMWERTYVPLVRVDIADEQRATQAAQAPSAAHPAVNESMILTPEWRGVLPILIAGLQNKASDVRQAAVTELRSMATKADQYVQVHSGSEPDGLKPTWVSLVPAFAAVMIDGTTEGKSLIKEQMANMAQAADLYVAHRQSELQRQQHAPGADKVQNTSPSPGM